MPAIPSTVGVARGIHDRKTEEANELASQRSLTQTEQLEAGRVFSTALNYSEIQVIEDTAWPDTIARIGSKLAGDPPPSHNAITLGNRIHFPVKLHTDLAVTDPVFLNDMSWLVHELTHTWQYQHDGPVYLIQALWAQIRLGSQAYAYGWEAGLRQAALEGKTLRDFNREQQGDIARHYYFRDRQGLNTQAWDPFIFQFQII